MTANDRAAAFVDDWLLTSRGAWVLAVGLSTAKAAAIGTVALLVGGPWWWASAVSFVAGLVFYTYTFALLRPGRWNRPRRVKLMGIGEASSYLLLVLAVAPLLLPWLWALFLVLPVLWFVGMNHALWVGSGSAWAPASESNDKSKAPRGHGVAMADETGGVFKGIDDRVACLSLGYSICRNIEAIEEVVDPEARREFNEDVIRPDSLNDVKEAIVHLVHDLTLASLPGGCLLAQDKVDELITAINRASQENDEVAMKDVIDRVSNTLYAPVREAKLT